MLVRLCAPYADTTAGDLSFTLDLPTLPALHVLRLSPPAMSPGRLPAAVELRLLGASHQVVWPAPDGTRRVETVACLPGHPPHLPGEVTDPHTGYQFSCTVRRPGRPVIAQLTQSLADDPYALVGLFPGDPHAVTALRLHAGGWRTWHAYPQTGELVTTRTVLETMP